MPVAIFRTHLGHPGPAIVEQAREALTGPGTLILSGALDREAVRAAAVAIRERLCGLGATSAERVGIRVGDGRYMVTLNLDPPFDSPALFASPAVLAVVRGALGVDAIINSLAVVIALPGAEDQRVHVDHGLLFPLDQVASETAPPYALTAIIPLLDLDESTGSTEVWPRGPESRVPDKWQSKLAGSTVLPLRVGDAALIDYRVCHGGTKNRGLLPRPILYIVYSRPWFRDADNFSEMPPLRVTAQHLANMPSEHRALFASVAAGHLV